MRGYQPQLRQTIDAALARLSAIIAPAVKAELAEALAAELERHFNERLLPELHARVEALIEEVLDKQVGEHVERALSARVEANQALVDRFSRVFQENIWGDCESVSGIGSRRDAYSVVLAISALRIIKEQIGFVSLNDIPCGDFNWIGTFLENNPEVSYRGFDIVPGLIQQNRMLYPSYKFDFLDITSTLPPIADLIFSKDLFNHLTFIDIRNALSNMKKSGSQYLLATNNFGFKNDELAGDPGASRYLDLCAAPLDLQSPTWRTDYFGLWELSCITID
jgi:hypothetical protein